MARHVDLLGLLFIVGGLLNGVVGVALLSLGFGAASLLLTDEVRRSGLAAAVAAALFASVAIALLIWGAAQVFVGSALRRHRPWSRLVSLVMAVLNLFIPPIGTALGVYGLWVLLNDQARQLFESTPA